MKTVQIDIEFETTIEIEVEDDCDITAYGWEDEYEDAIAREVNFYPIDNITNVEVVK